MIERLKGAIFDLDGTLLDSMHVWFDIGPAYLKSIGIEPEADIRERLRTMTLEEAAAFFRVHYGLKRSVQEIVDDINRLIEHEYFENVPLKPGVKEALSDMREKGVKMCIATATDRYLVEAALRRLKIAPYFQRIFTCSEIGKGKTEPDIFLCAQAELGTKREETWVFEDSVYAVRAAKSAGFPVAGVYDSYVEAREEDIEKLCDAYLRSWKEWPV
jgi:HAD superfamily hydrolase (TIGR01509 family)